MKFIILKESLEQGLNIISKAITGKTARPELNGVKLEMNFNGLYLTASDKSINIITKIPLTDADNKTLITLFEEGVVLINAKSLIEIVRKLDSESLEIEMIENNVLKIKNNVSNFSLNCMDIDTYPMIDVNATGEKFTIKTKDFIAGVNQTNYASSDRDTTPILEGVNLSAKGNELAFAATDSFRIARKIVNLDAEANFSVTIPSKIIADVAKIAESDENMTVTICERKVAFKFEHTLVITRVINGVYPDLLRVIPKEFHAKLVADPSKLAASIDRTSTLSTDRSGVVKFILSREEFKVVSRSQEIGSGSDTLSAFDYSGEPLEISFVSRYILDALKSLGSGDVKFEFTDGVKPVLITSTTDETIIACVVTASY